ncbi:MAG: CbtB-domain containing protein [Paludibacteraceae bacterium]|nr:CbtB-domain containing protein [Paludibacteraceae bacterium]
MGLLLLPHLGHSRYDIHNMDHSTRHNKGIPCHLWFRIQNGRPKLSEGIGNNPYNSSRECRVDPWRISIRSLCCGIA